jgi:prepilin-type processing-associated H-X9-DG protein
MEPGGSPGLTFYVGIAGLGSNAAELLLSDPSCGFFGYERRITPDDVPRGTSYTMMACETTWQNGPWARGGFATVRGLDPNGLPYTGGGRPFGGLHPGVTNRLFADGNVQPFRDTGSAKEFAALASLAED